MEIKKRNDRKLLAAFTAEMERRGYSIDQATETIGVGRSTFFRWQKIGVVSKRGRRAMATFIPSKDKEPTKAAQSVTDPLLQIVIDAWQTLDAEERGRLAGIVQGMTEAKKPHVG